MDQPVIVVDLGYGDAGKGGIVDWLCSPGGGRPPGLAEPVHTVVRFNGGAQAAHNVVRPDGTSHTFAQFGSGTLNPGTRTHLSRFMMVDLLALVAEAEHLAGLGVADPFGLISVDGEALLTTPYHQAANRARELARGASRHGSCGMGVGETASYALLFPNDAPRAADSPSSGLLERKLATLRDRLADDTGFDVATVPPPAVVAAAYRDIAARLTITGEGHLATLLRRPGRVVFEGAQGVLLDEWRGFHPYTTWSTTTFGNAERLLAEARVPVSPIRLGVTRTYMTRHGPGPFVTEDPALRLPEPHNQAGRWQGPVRVGHLDAVMLRYAVDVCGGVDAIALTHLDTARSHAGHLRICRQYEWNSGRFERLKLGPERDLGRQERLTQLLQSEFRPVYDSRVPAGDDEWCDAVAEIAGAPVTVRSSGPAATQKAGDVRAVAEAVAR